jgi:iron complex transport system ATP-binding protein
MERVRRIAQAGTTLILITHHVEEIIPEIGRVILLSHGRIVDDAAKTRILSDEVLSRAFDGPMGVEQRDGDYLAGARR